MLLETRLRTTDSLGIISLPACQLKRRRKTVALMEDVDKSLVVMDMVEDVDALAVVAVEVAA